MPMTGLQKDRPVRLAIVVTHPIQHFVHFYRALARDPGLALTVVYGAPIGLKPYFDREMNVEIAWNMDSLTGYDHQILEPDQGDEQPRFMAPNAPGLAKALDALAPDAVLVYGYAQINALRALRWCRSRGVPAMMTGDSELSSVRSPLKAAVKSLVIPLILSRFSAFLSVGDGSDAYYTKYGVSPDRIFRSPFTIDEETFKDVRVRRAQLRSEIRQHYGIAGDAFVSLFVGKLSERKRPMDLLDAVTLLDQDKAGARHVALFAGNGDQLAAMQSRVEQDGAPVKLAGFVNVDKLPDFYAAADVLVHPSSADPHPLVCSEAACVGLPMILSDRIGAAGPTDIARPDVNASIYPVGNVPMLADALRLLAQDEGRYAEMAAQSLAIFDELDMRRSVKGMLDAVDYAVRQRAPAHSTAR